MTVQLQKPMIVGGLVLSAGFLGIDALHHAVADVGDFLMVGTMAAGGGYWWWSRRRTGSTTPPPVEMNHATLEHLIAQANLAIERLTIEGAQTEAIDRLKQQLQQAIQQADRQQHQIAVTGGARVGKTSLIEGLQGGTQPCQFLETPPLFGTAEHTDEVLSQQLASQADLVIFITNGDLTATEYRYLEKLSWQQRLLLVFNKQDRYLPADRAAVNQKIKQTIANLVSADNVVATSAQPTAIKVKKIQTDGTVWESIEQPPVDLDLLQQRLQAVLTQEGTQLILATAYRQINQVKVQGKLQLNSLRRQQAIPLIEQKQWIVGAAAFANPLPALDLLAAAVVNAQMIMDLSGIYQQKFSLEQAQAAASAMGSLLLKLGLIELSTQAIGSVLKTNAVTFVAGGLLQGLSAAYLTRIVGLTLVEYFADQDVVVPQANPTWNIDRFSTILSQVFQTNQRLTMLQDFVRQGLPRLVPEAEAV